MSDRRHASLPTGGLPPLFWYPGGKRRVAGLVWEALGNVRTYVEPFAGSLAVLLARPPAHLTPSTGRRIEVINDWSGRLVNFYRAARRYPDAVWQAASGPRTTLDLNARHAAINAVSRALDERLRADPDWCDPVLAGWQLYTLRYATHPRTALATTETVLGRPAEIPPQLIRADVEHLAARLEASRALILCGDWSKAVAPRLTVHAVPTGVFLDPPYLSVDRRDDLYVVEGRDAAAACRAWAIEHGEDPRFRIVLAGYADEGCPDGWTEHSWSSIGGGASRHAERLWMSPHCLPVGQDALVLA